MIYRSVYTALLLMLFCVPALSQDASEAIQKLAGGKEKLWTFEKIVRPDISPNGCEKGETWRFYADGNVSVRKCENKVLRNYQKHWEVRQISDIDIGITISGEDYLLIFLPSEGGKEQMILRKKPRKQTEEAVDIYFQHP